MTEIECSRCGEVFDTDRETAAPKADTARCPSCGNKNAVPATDGGSTGGETVAQVEMTLTVEITTNQL